MDGVYFPEKCENEDEFLRVDGSLQGFYRKTEFGTYIRQTPDQISGPAATLKTEVETLKSQIADYKTKFDVYGDLTTEEIEDLRQKAARVEELEAGKSHTTEEAMRAAKAKADELYKPQITGLEERLQAERDGRITDYQTFEIDRAKSPWELTPLGERMVPMLLKESMSTNYDEESKTIRHTFLDSNGEISRNEKLEPMTTAEKMLALKAQHPELFVGTKASGPGLGEQSSENKQPGMPSNDKPSTWTNEQRDNYMRVHGVQAMNNAVNKERMANRTARAQQQQEQQVAGGAKHDFRHMI